jgi:hypothetical protein
MSTRRRIAGFILLIGVLFVGSRFLGARDRLVDATVVYKLPEGTKHLEALAFVHGQDAPVARLVANELDHAPDVTQKTKLPPGALQLVVTLDDGAPEKRSIEVAAGAIVTVDLRR